MKYWIMKSEPETYGIEDLAREKNQTGCWEGVRNYQARNMMRDDMKVGDKVFFYHSSCKHPGIVATATVVKEAYPDFTSWDPTSKYFDPKSTKENPRWFMVDIKLDENFAQPITLQVLKEHKFLSELLILRAGNRLSITPISKQEWESIMKLKIGGERRK
jgi:predicted RNA-binding protein with PUA-like domain